MKRVALHSLSKWSVAEAFFNCLSNEEITAGAYVVKKLLMLDPIV